MSQRTAEGAVLQEMGATLNDTISTQSGPDRFGSAMSSAGFVAEPTVRDITTTLGIANNEKVNRIMAAVINHITTSGGVTQTFNEFILLLYNNLRLDNLAQQLVKKLEGRRPGYQSPLSKGTGTRATQPVLTGNHSGALPGHLANAAGTSEANSPTRMETDSDETKHRKGRSLFGSDFHFKALSNDDNDISTFSLLRLEKVHQEGIIGKNTRLAIIEEKFNSNHEAFIGLNLESVAYDPDDLDFDHGTSVVGIAVGRKIHPFESGVAPGATVKVFPLDMEDPYPSMLQQFKAISDAVPKYNIVSISCGGLDTPPDDVDHSIRDIIAVLKSHGTTIFAASGNDGDQEPVRYPASLGDVISVGSLTAFAKLAEHTKTKGVDVYCYGDGVVAPYGSGTELKTVYGSSMAAPAVAGLACLALQCAKLHGYEKLRYRKEMLSMLNTAMRARGEGYAFDPEGFLLNALESNSAFENL